MSEPVEQKPFADQEAYAAYATEIRERAIDQIKIDCLNNDLTAVDEMLSNLPLSVLEHFLAEETLVAVREAQNLN